LKNEILAVVLAMLILASLGIGYFAGVSNRQTSTTTSTRILTSVSFITTTAHVATTSPAHGSDVSLLNVSGSYYWADDVSRDINVPNPGYSYFLNGSVTFDGVKFTTICPPTYSGCPGSNGNSTTVTTVLAGAIRFNMTFPDGTTETTGEVIGDSIFTLVLSQHQPRAGMLIEYVNDYGDFSNSVDYVVFLLISSCGASPYVC
jgi:hypothetical protein